MTEALTESFCERCGTRYEFETETELSPLRKTRGLLSGLKNYILSQEALGDAVGDAIRGEEEAIASKQLDAFHDTFSFCLDCRQYTCQSCWNDGAGRCRSCVPVPGQDDLAERLQAAFAAQEVLPPPVEEAQAWPTTDMPGVVGAEPLVVAEAQTFVETPTFLASQTFLETPAEAELVVEPELPAEAEAPVEPEPLLAAEAADLDEEDEPEPMEPGQLAARLAYLDRMQTPPAAVQPELIVEPEAIVAPEPVVEPEPMAAMHEEPAAPVTPPAPPEPAYRPITPLFETILRPTPEPPVEAPRVAAEAVDDEALAARRAQLDMLGIGEPGAGPVAGSRGNVLPYRSSGAAPHASEHGRAAGAGLPASSALWAASAHEVTHAPSAIGVRDCGSCGLSLSASARFCRRCGTPQQRSA